MVNKKSAFIDKRRAATYHLVASTRGPDDEDGAAGETTQRVFTRVAGEGQGVAELEEDDEAAARAQDEPREADAYADYPAWMRPQPPLSAARRAELLELGFPDDGYDYLQHCRDLSNTGGAGVHFVPAVTKPEVAADARIYDARAVKRVHAAPMVGAQGAVALSRNAELAEVEAALAAAEAERGLGQHDEEEAEAHGAELAGEGDLEDDFITAVLDAETGPSESEEEAEEEEAEEDDAELEAEAAVIAMAAASERARAARATRPLDAAFEALASAEYSDTEIGDLDHDAAAARGTSDVAAYGRVLSAFRDSSAGAEACATVADMDAARRRARAMALAEREADDAAGSDDDDDGDDDGEDDDDADAGSSSGAESEEDPEERAAREALQVTRISLGLPPSARLDGVSGVPPRPLPLRGVVLPEDEEVPGDELPVTELVRVAAEPRDRWDCETIVSTYSNLENRPAVLDGGAPRRQRGGAASSAAASGAAMPAQIRLGKTGLPVEFVPRAKPAGGHDGGGDSDEGDSDDGADVGPGAEWRCETRRKGETAEEKRARKAAVKEGRREARAQKKETKSLFKAAAAATRSVPVTGAVRPGASVTPLL